MLPTTSTLINTQATAARVRPELLRLPEDLPRLGEVELSNFARCLRQQTAVTDERLRAAV